MPKTKKSHRLLQSGETGYVEGERLFAVEYEITSTEAPKTRVQVVSQDSLSRQIAAYQKQRDKYVAFYDAKIAKAQSLLAEFISS